MAILELDQIQNRKTNLQMAEDIMISRSGLVTTILDFKYIMDIDRNKAGELLKILMRMGKLTSAYIQGTLYYALINEEYLFDEVERTQKDSGLKPSDYPYLDNLARSYNLKPIT